MDNIKEYPVVLCDEREDGVCGLQFYCEYCKKIHKHGTGEGHRVAHCFGDTPYTKSGYILKLRK